MADLQATPPTGEIAYRPVSILALSGFALALVFAGLVALSTLVALIQGLPLFLSGWTMVFAVGGAVLSLLALLRIRNSEGTLAGTALARWGMWLSILLGVTYFVYAYVTGLALTIQANDFVMEKKDEDSGFLPRLLAASTSKAELYHAFLLTLPATNRGSVKPENEERMLDQFDRPRPDGEPGLLAGFRLNPLVLALAPGPKEVTIQPLGVQEWSYEKESYQVRRNYRIVTPENTIEVLLIVRSTEGGEGERRKWFVVQPAREAMRITPTLLGNTIATYRFYSRVFLDKWHLERNQGVSFSGYKESDTDWNTVLPKKLMREHVQKLLADYYGGALKRPEPVRTVALTNENFSPWSQKDGRLRIIHTVNAIFPATDNFPPYSVGLDIDTVSKTPVDVQQPYVPSTQWEVQSVRVTRANPAPKSKGLGPGM